jgi:hypothetical protein
MAVIAALTLVAALGLLGLGITVGGLFTTGGRPRTNQPGGQVDTGTPRAQNPTFYPTSVEPPTPTATPVPGRPTTPDDALALADERAIDELNLEADESAQRVPALQGSWVPQVSSKCVGIPVDIGPDWFPDGMDDTPHITIQQLLAFHLSMSQHFGALTVHPTQLGVRIDQATTGPCAGQTIWTSVVPRTFGSAQDANAWCSANLPPIRECGARYVARPGESSTLVLRR